MLKRQTETFKMEKEEVEIEDHEEDVQDHKHFLEIPMSEKDCSIKETENLSIIHPWNKIPLQRPVSSSKGLCEHKTQCVVRQPFSQPLPSITFMRHEVSKYEQHMINRSSFHGCLKCFSIDNDNYGCGDCTWLKWWFKWHGLRHGFPDIHPSVYKRYT